MSSIHLSILFLALILGLALPAAILWGIQDLLSRLLRKAFPMGVFLIGQGLKRHQDTDLLRTVVILGFLVSVVAGVLVSVLVR
jgi:hypothetical protein